MRDVVAHVAGALEEGARRSAQLRRIVLGPRRYPHLTRLDAINQLQVDDRRTATEPQLLAEVAALGPKAARARRRLPRLVRRHLEATSTEADVVALVVRDLAHVWDGPPTRLTLTGHGAGSWRLGAGPPQASLEADAVEICRMLSGRTSSPTITAEGDPGAEARLRATRVSF